MKDETLSFSQFVRLCKGRLIGAAGDGCIRHLLIDSRKYRGQADCIFFAIPGEVHDGHQHIEELYWKGVRLFVVQQELEITIPEALVVQVENTIEALQKLAAHHRKQFSYPVVAITGSNGKTVVKEWAHQLLAPNFAIVRSPKSYNSQVGVPLSLWGMGASHELALIEAGISMPGEMEKLERMIRPSIGIMTNIGSAHQEHFPTIAQKVKSKMSLFKRADLLIYCSDHKLIHKRALKLKGPQLLSWSFHPTTDDAVQVISQRKSGGFTHLKVQSAKGLTQFRIPFLDSASVENAMHLFCLMEYLGIGKQKIQQRMAGLQAVDMRLELKEGVQQSLLINDGYNSDIESFRIALEFLQTHRKQKRALVVLSDMATGLPEQWVPMAAQLLRELQVDDFIGVGPLLLRHADQFPKNSQFFADTASLLQALSTIDWSHRVILLKGSRVFAFEQLLAKLERQHHQTVLRIDMNALADNLNAIRAQVPAPIRLMAVVKAFSYGAGSAEVAALLQFQKVDYLAVAYADEGVALRNAGIQLPIMVMNPEPDSLEAMIEHSLEPEIYSFRMLELFLQVLHRLNYTHARYPIHLKLDTGMHRLGFEMDQLPTLAALLKAEKQLQVVSVFSHLAASDEVRFRKETLLQIERFKLMSEQIALGIGYRPLRHILNSAGIEAYPKAHFEMVRLGIGLHGTSSSHPRPVAALYTHISQIKWLRKGESLGYGFSFTATQDMKIATIAIGYADGFSRRFSNGKGEVFIAGQRAQVVGRVCMDLTMVDISQIDCQEGDEVEVFGKNIRVQELANKLETIPYEVLTAISPRVKRIYLQE